MASPYVVNISINTSTSFTQSFTLSNENGSTLNLSNYQIKSQLRKHPQSNSYINFITTAVSPSSGGVVKISLEPNSTSSLKPGRYLYDIILTNNSTGDKTKVIEGSAIVTKSITRDS
jgi:hypothetical protein